MADDEKNADEEVQQLIDERLITEYEVGIIRQVAHRIGTDGLKKVAESAWDENGDPRF